MTFDSQHFCDGSAGKIHTSFGYVVRGSTHITTGNVSLDLAEGSFFFLPEGIRYRSEWVGAPRIEYYMLHMLLTPQEKQKYMPSEIKALSGQETLQIIRRIEAELKAGGVEQFSAVGRLYALCASAIPLLTPWKDHHDNPALSKAIEYIKENFDRDFTMAELAKHCFLSESRLYHLFKDELNTSPLQLRNEIRVNKAVSMIKLGRNNTRDILIETGFSSASYFRKIFKEQTGMSFSEYDKLMTR